MNAVNMTTSELCALASCSKSTLTRWIKSGLPHTRQPSGHGGAKVLVFPKKAALDWVAVHANVTASRAAIAQSGKCGGETSAPVSDGVAELADEGLLACLSRMRKTERQTFELLARLKKAGDVGAALAVSERYVAESRALASLEAAAIQHQTRSGELVDRAAMQAVYGRVIISVKNAVLGVPSSAVPLLMPFLKDPEKAHDVFSILDRLCRAALQAASDKHSRPKP